jgi:putative FmdB family regulatory protein
MPRYDYECESCGHRQEHACTMSARPDRIPCSCGKAARQIIAAVPYSFVRGAEYEFDPAKVVGNNGVLAGRSLEQQHAGYRKIFDALKTSKQRRKRSLGKGGDSVDGGIRILGYMPGEMVDSIGQQEGDKEAVAKDPEHFMRATGMWLGD